VILTEARTPGAYKLCWIISVADSPGAA
jgi:hypothetical protein